MSGRVPQERMAELRRGSKLRQRLQMEVDEASQHVQSTEENIHYQHHQLSQVEAYETDPAKREQEVAYLEADIRRLQSQLTLLQERLAAALQDLQDFEEATQEVSERSRQE